MGRSEKSPDSLAAAKLAGPGDFKVSVVGGSHYQKALEAICGGRSDQGVRYQTTAILILDDQNPYDDKAVRVEIDGQVVSYLTRDYARQYRKALEQAGRPALTTSCEAMIVGGWDRHGERGHFGVRLDLPTS